MLNLENLEQVIVKHQSSYYLAGKALFEIKENALYQETEFKTFEQYCKNKFCMSSSHSYRLISFYKTASILHKDETWQISERAVRKLSEEKDEKTMASIWNKAEELANEDNQKVSEKHIAQAWKIIYGDDDTQEATLELSAEYFVEKSKGNTTLFLKLIDNNPKVRDLPEEMKSKIKEAYDKMLQEESVKKSAKLNNFLLKTEKENAQ